MRLFRIHNGNPFVIVASLRLNSPEWREGRKEEAQGGAQRGSCLINISPTLRLPRRRIELPWAGACEGWIPEQVLDYYARINARVTLSRVAEFLGGKKGDTSRGQDSSCNASDS